MTKLIDLYRSVLKFTGLETDAEGYVSAVVGEKKQPAVIDGARLVLPLDNHLRTYVKGEKIIFHPLTENILRGESEIIEKLKTSLNVKLNFTFGVIGQSLLKLVASPEYHGRLNPDQLDIMVAIKDCDEKTVVNFINVMVNGCKTKVDRLFVNIYLKRGGTVNAKRFSRVGIVSFPLYKELQNDEVDKIRVKDKETFLQLYKFIFPDIETVDCYNYGSNSQIAPYLDSLMRTGSNIASRLNDIIYQFKDYIDDYENLIFDSEWIELFENLDDLASEIRRIPVQYGNDGTAGQPEQISPVVLPVPVQQQPVQQQVPVMQNMVPVQQPQQPQVKTTKRGLDFNSVVNSNPAMQYGPNPFGRGPQMMPGMQNPNWSNNAAMAASMAPPGFMQQPQMYPQQMYPQQMYPQQMMPQQMNVQYVLGQDGNTYIVHPNGQLQFAQNGNPMGLMYRM